MASAADPSKRPLPLEDLNIRPPEWEELVRNPGAGPLEADRHVYWDYVHGWVYQTAAVVQIRRPDRPL